MVPQKSDRRSTLGMGTTNVEKERPSMVFCVSRGGLLSGGWVCDGVVIGDVRLVEVEDRRESRVEMD